ncbi:MAG: ATP/GTP-binding protein [Erysipelotrichaceae bacterium]
MITSISVKNFRGLKNLVLPDMKQIVLVSGKNNTGKSSILESIFLLADHISGDCFAKVNSFRNISYLGDCDSLWAPVFYNLEVENSIEIVANIDGEITELSIEKDDSFTSMRTKEFLNKPYTSAKTSYSIKMQFKKGAYTEKANFVLNDGGIVRELSTTLDNNAIMPMPFIQYINAILGRENVMEYFGRIELSGKKQKIISALQIIDPQITDISAIVQKGNAQLYVKKNGRLLATKLAGEGVNQLLTILLSIISNPDSIILIDEIETGFHYSMYKKLWETIAISAKENNCQIIATTHSYECIVEAVEGLSDSDILDDFVYYRISLSEEENKAYRYSGTMLKHAVDSNLEVR